MKDGAEPKAAPSIMIPGRHAEPQHVGADLPEQPEPGPAKSDPPEGREVHLFGGEQRGGDAQQRAGPARAV